MCEKHHLSEMEFAYLANLCPVKEAEAKSLIPSLRRLDDDELGVIVEELQRLKGHSAATSM